MAPLESTNRKSLSPVQQHTHVKLRNMEVNKSWNDNNEKLIVSVGENAVSYKWMHEKNAAHCSLINKVLQLIMIVLNTSLSAQTLIPGDRTPSDVVSIVSQVIIYIVTVLSVVINFLKFEDLAAKHASYALKFSKLYHDIQQEMSLYRKDRQPAVEFVKNKLKELDDLVVAAPSIDERILTRFKKTFENSDIAVPTLADRITKIEVLPSKEPTNLVSNTNNTSPLVVPRTGRPSLHTIAQSNNLGIPGDICDDE